MAKIIGVKFRNTGKTYYFDPGRYFIKAGTGVIVETTQGTEFADVVIGTKDINESELSVPLKGIVRIATKKDIEMAASYRAKEHDALLTAEKKIAEHKLDMKLVRVEYAFDGSKLVFFFTSDGRVDFRELVKDLASTFRTRIELRQIGARDEAKLLGGLGPCGLPCCCSAYMNDFQPVSIKMAKEQGLSLNPTKISGLCGRLMCCLKFEQSTYEKVHRLLPRLNSEVKTPDGKGVVCEQNVLKETVKVKLTLPSDAVDIREYHFKQVTVIKSDSGKRRKEEPEEIPEGLPLD